MVPQTEVQRSGFPPDAEAELPGWAGFGRPAHLLYHAQGRVGERFLPVWCQAGCRTGSPHSAGLCSQARRLGARPGQENVIRPVGNALSHSPPDDALRGQPGFRGNDQRLHTGLQRGMDDRSEVWAVIGRDLVEPTGRFGFGVEFGIGAAEEPEHRRDVPLPAERPEVLAR